ncbi:MAG: hypothetical protein IJ065_04040 [Eubacterium sp.]|nr:hypothetical protein [Eubacterium sp.]
MFKSMSDFALFIGAVFFICAVIALVIEKVRTKRLLKVFEQDKDLIKFYKSKWSNENFRVVGIIIICYLIIACVGAVFKLTAVLVIASIALIIAYIIINLKMMAYVEEMVQNK